MIPDTNLDDIEDEVYRRLLTLERYRDYPMNVDDQSQLLDLLKLLVVKVIMLEQKIENAN